MNGHVSAETALVFCVETFLFVSEETAEPTRASMIVSPHCILPTCLALCRGLVNDSLLPITLMTVMNWGLGQRDFSREGVQIKD
jgi:hypothetical protein